MFSTICKKCNIEVNTSYKYDIDYCKICLESKLIEINCKGNKNKKCDNILCKNCYESSFLSHEKSNCWSSKNTEKPRQTPLKSGKQFYFECDRDTCKHIFNSKLINVVSGGTWCGFCSGREICGNENCKKCFDKSFASLDKSKYWDYEKNKDENGNVITPFQVTKSSNKNFYLICDKNCGHSYNIKLSNSTNLNRNCSYCAGKILCDDENCKMCFDKSFNSQNMSNYWDNSKNKDEKGNIILPRHVFKSTASKYNFKCCNENCNNTMEIRLNDINYDSRKCEECQREIFDKNKERHNKCIFNDNCEAFALYNIKNENTPLYCKEHKKYNMIDVKNEHCIFENCQKYKIYAYENEKRLYCKDHKKDNMIDVATKRCKIEGCELTASFNMEQYKNPLYCSEHMKNDMVDVRHPRCKGTMCQISGNKKYNGYCMRCFIYLFPDEKVSRNYKIKEKHVIDKIKQKFPNFDWIEDKKVKDGCSKKRPDLLIDFGFHVLLIEIDEDQHKNYSCENKRIMELSQDFNHRSIIFIRFNPDGYVNKKNEKITSCFIMNSSNILVIKQNKKNEFEERLEELYKQIEFWSEYKNMTEKTIEIVQLFYDGYL